MIPDAPKAPEVSPTFSDDQIATPPTSEPFIDTLRTKITAGPWVGSVLHLPNLDSAAAQSQKWGVLYDETPHDMNAPLPPPLTPAEQSLADEAATYYAQTGQIFVEPPVNGRTAR